MKSITTYLTFAGNCRQAMEFYHQCLGGDLMVMRYSDAPMPCPDADRERVMHSRIVEKGHVLIMASDAPGHTAVEPGNNFSISVDCESAAEADQRFQALSHKGQVKMPMQKTFWAERFGMLQDQFGVAWMFNVETPPQG